MRHHSLVLLVGLLGGCIHNWSAYEPPADSAPPFDNVMLDIQPIDIPRPDVPDVVDVTAADLVDNTPPVDVVDVPPPMDVVDVPPPEDVVDVPITPDVPVVDVPTSDVPCGANGAACCAPALCAPSLLCRVDMVCATACAPMTTQCGSVCFDTQNDSNNCGSCGNSCTGGRVCMSGNCVRP